MADDWLRALRNQAERNKGANALSSGYPFHKRDSVLKMQKIPTSDKGIKATAAFVWLSLGWGVLFLGAADPRRPGAQAIPPERSRPR